MKRPAAALLGCIAVLLLLTVTGIASIPTVQTGTWHPMGSMVAARSGAAGELLQDHRVLITGGDSGNGAVNSAEVLNEDGTFAAVSAMGTPRSGHVAVVLKDGRALVAGGVTAGGGATNSAEIYDPTSDSWSVIAGGMVEARSKASISLLKDGRVLIAGGQNGTTASATVEIFDPGTGQFSFAGTLSSPRMGPASAGLADGRVLITGGSNGSAPVASSDVFDPTTNTVSVGPAMASPRVGHSATALLDGRVLVAGGNNGSADLASAEVFDPATGGFAAVAASLAAPRTDFSAILLPNNNAVLIVGGTSAGNEVSTAETFTPWTGTFAVTGSPAVARQQAAVSSLNQDGLLLMAGGTNAGSPASSTELYGFATVKTDAADYAPGTVVTITGTGWQPGETVTLTLVESPLIDTHPVMTAVADGQGKITNSEFSPDVHDLNIQFYLTAVGSQSGYQAQNTFTDANNDSNTLAITCTSNSLVVGNTTTCTATETDTASTPNNGSPLGTIAWSISPTAEGTFSPTSCTLVPVPSTVTSTCSATFTAKNVGSGTVSASYSRANNNWSNGTSSNNFSMAVTKASTNSAVTSGTNPSVFGQSVTFTANVTAVAPGAGTATGNVTFKDGATTLGTGTLNGSGVATFSTSALSVTTHSVTAVYNGDSNFNTSTSSAISQVVNQAGTTTSLASSVNPSSTGQSVTFTATVAAASPGAGTATGTVTFKDGATTLGTGTLNGSGVATFATSALALGPHSITAVYGGDTNFTGSTSSILTQTVNQATTTTAVASSANPSVFGQSVTFTATVTGSGGGTPTGTVTFKDGAATLGTGALNGSGVATFATSALSVATHSITAVYGGDSNFAGSTSSVLSQVVNQANTSTALTSSPNPSVFGQTVNFTVTVAVVSPGVGTPTGTVQVKMGNTVLGSGTLSGGQAIIAVSSGLTVGANGGIKAFYNGDTNFAASQTQNAMVQTVNQASTTTTIASSGSPSNYGQSVTFTATVAVVAPGAGTPTGTVNFYDGGTCAVPGASLGSGVLSGTTPFQASASTATLDAAHSPHTVLACYAGDTNFLASNGSTSQIVNKASVTVTITASDKTYDGTNAATITNCTISTGKVGTDDVGCSASNATFASANASPSAQTVTATVTLTGTTAGNYTLGANNTATTTAKINAKSVTPSITADDKDYDGTTAATIHCTVAGVLAADATNVTCNGTGTFADANAGSGKTVTSSNLTLGGSASGNYVLSTTTATTTATINKKSVTPSITADNKDYDGTTAATIHCTISGVLAADSANVTCSGTGTFAEANAGPSKTVTSSNLALGGSAAGNYMLSSTTATTTATINKKSVTPSITADNKDYDGTTAATIHCTISGVLAADTANVTCTGTGTFSDANAGPGKTVTSNNLTLGGTASGNYMLSTTTATTTATINKKSVTPSITADDKDYDTTNAATIHCTLSGVLAADTANVTCSGTGTFADANAGPGKTVTSNNLALGGSAAGNYVLSSTTATTTATIRQKSVTPSITADDKDYDTTTAATIHCTLSGVLATDTANVTCSGTGAFANGNAGPGKTVTSSNLTLGGSAAGNYVLSTTSATTTATIRQKSVTPSITADDKDYDTTTAATIHCTLSGVMTADMANVTCSGTGAFADANAGPGKTVTSSNLTLGGSAAGNYVLSTTSATTTATIRKVDATVNVTPYSETYNGAPHTATGTATGVGGVDLGAGLNLTATTHTDAGDYPADPWTFSGGQNYNDKSGTVHDHIDKATPTVTVSFAASSTTYDGNPHPATATATGVNNEALTPVNVAYTVVAAPPRTPGDLLTSAPADAGSYQAAARFAGNTNYYQKQSVPAPLVIEKADSTTTVSCPTNVTFDGSPQAPCTASVTGAGGLSLTPTPTYTNNVNAGTATASYTYAGDANHNGSSGTKTFTIDKAASVTTVSCPTNVTYNGSAQEPCTASVTGAGGLNQALTPTYSNNLSAGTATATASFAGDANHTGSSDSKNFTIDKAASVTTVSCPTSVTYNGSAQEPCTVSVTGAGGLSLTPTPTYTNNVDAGTATASYTYAGDANHNGSSGTKNFTIDKAASVTTVSCPTSVTYNGSAQEPCTASVTGAGGLSLTPTPTYTNNVDAGTATASYTYGGDANHNGSNDSKNFTIDKAASVTLVSCPTNVTYSGSAQTPCSASVTGAGGLSQSLTPTYSNNTDAGTATASASFAGDANHTGSSDSKNFTIDKAASVTAVTCPAFVTYNGSAQTPCSASVTGAGGLNQTLTPSYSNNVDAGTATASASFAGDANHTGSSDSKNFTIDKAASVTTVTCPSNVTFTGSALTPCSATVTGAGGLSLTPTPSYSNNTNVGAATASYSYAGDANHSGSSDSKNFAIDKASSVTTVTCPTNMPYTGAALTPCSASVTGAGGLNQSLVVGYSNNLNAGTASASASYAGDPNHDGSSDSKTFTIDKVASTTNVTCPVSVNYNALPQTPCTATVSGVGGLSQTVSVSYSNNTNAGTASASASYPGDGNHTGSSDSKNFTINKAVLTVKADNKSMILHATLPMFTVSYSGFKGSDTSANSVTGAASLSSTATSASPVGTYAIVSANGTLAANNYSFAFTNGTLTIAYSIGACLGDLGHTILQPINPDGSSVFNSKSTSPAKFRVCDASGASIGAAGVVQGFLLYQTINGTSTSTVNEPVDSTTPDANFRWDPSAQQWIFNINNKALTANKTYVFVITLNDQTTIPFQYGLR